MKIIIGDCCFKVSDLLVLNRPLTLPVSFWLINTVKLCTGNNIFFVSHHFMIYKLPLAYPIETSNLLGDKHFYKFKYNPFQILMAIFTIYIYEKYTGIYKKSSGLNTFEHINVINDLNCWLFPWDMHKFGKFNIKIDIIWLILIYPWCKILLINYNILIMSWFYNDIWPNQGNVNSTCT